MALLTTKGVYGLMAVLEIANASEISPISIKEISDKTGISKGYLEQILNTLRSQKLILSIKGKGGGYFLGKSLDKITLYELFSLLEKDFGMTNLEVESEALKLFFSEKDEKLKELFSTPLSEISKFEEKHSKYLNYII